LLRSRIIPALTVDFEALVKTTKFRNPKYVGDPLNAIRIFNEKEVDELLFLDITATRDKREPNYRLIEEIAGECFMPLTYGGAINSIDQAKKIFKLGVEKICLQTSVMQNPCFISKLADIFGSQSIMVSIDVKRNIFKKPKVYNYLTRKLARQSWLEVINKFVELGAGEVLLNDVDRDGTLLGPDVELIRDASGVIEVPMIAIGGASSLYDISEMIKAGASAAAAGSFFVYHGPHKAVLITYPTNAEIDNLFTLDRE